MNDQNKIDLEPENQTIPRAPLRKAKRKMDPFSQETVIETENNELPDETIELQISAEKEEDLSLPADLKIEDSANEIDKIQAFQEENSDEAESDSLDEEESLPLDKAVSDSLDKAEPSPLPEEVENPFEILSAEEEKKEELPLSPAANTFDWIKTFLLSLTSVIFVFTLIFRGVTVNGASMLPTLENGDYLVISDLIYTPETGDIVVVQSPHFKNGTEPLIKRIIATEGQNVCINFATWKITVDGVELKEDYILKDEYSVMRPEDMLPDEKGEVHFQVEENCVFVMGDNRNDSLDSRSASVGQIDERYIMGRVLFRITPFDRFGKVN